MTMTTAIANMSPIDAARAVTFDLPDCRSARVNRFGIGFGQRGFWGNEHYSTREAAEAGWEARLADLRVVYGTPGRNWTGRYLEEEMPIGEGFRLLRGVRFVPLKKNGKPGVTIHTIQMYPIDVSDSRVEAIAAALKMPVS